MDDPYGSAHAQPLKVGLFVEASIQASVLEDVYVLPRTALREARYILTLDAEQRIHRTQVEPLWMDKDVIVFRDPSIKPGTLVTTTPLALAIDGLKVLPAGAARPERPGGTSGQGRPEGGRP